MVFKYNSTSALIWLNCIGIVITLLLSAIEFTFELGTSLILLTSIILFFKKKLFYKADKYYVLMILCFAIGTLIFLFYVFTNKYFQFPRYVFEEDMFKSAIRAKLAVGLVLFNSYALCTRLTTNEMLAYLDVFFKFCMVVLVIIFIVNSPDFITLYNTPARLFGFSYKPNQLAAIITILPFLNYLSYKRGTINKFLYYMFLMVLIVIGVLTESEALILSLILTYIIIGYISLYNYLFKRDKSIAIQIVFYTILAIIIIGPIIMYYLFGYFDQGRQQASGRINIWSNALRAYSYSPLFGFGPGSYSSAASEPFAGKEAHNTILDFIGYGGLVFLLILGHLYYLIIKRFGLKNILVTALLCITLYGLFHNNGRTPYFWILIFFTHRFSLTHTNFKDLIKENKGR